MQEIPRDRLKKLAKKMLTGEITPAEKHELEKWLNTNPANDQVWELGDTSEEALRERLFSSIVKDSGAKLPVIGKKIKPSYYWSAAACILILVTAGLYFAVSTKNTEQPKQAVVAPKEKITPGTDKAILTLSDGRKVMLEGQKVIADGDLRIQNENNELVYSATNVMAFNTMSTPRGGQYQLRLPDGSRVWLNSASSITYPTVFTGKERVIKLSGEAYFEISRNKSMPFKVQVNDMEVKVLGTHFNVMAYTDEHHITTTLVEGSVSISKGQSTALLNPGQEATVTPSQQKINVSSADVEQATAWKNGMFVFNRTSIGSIMRQLSRWYDFDIKFESASDNRHFSGVISRKTELANVLKMLQMTKDVNFSIEGRTVTVLP